MCITDFIYPPEFLFLQITSKEHTVGEPHDPRMDSCFSWLFNMFVPAGIPYESAKLRAQTFDLVYFCQMSKWTAPFITLFSGKLITHMGIIWKDPSNGELYLFESVRNQDTSKDVLTGNVHAGVRLVSLAEKVNRPTESYFICIQPIQMTSHKRREAEPLFEAFIRTHIGVPFEQRPSTMVRSLLSPSTYGYTPEDVHSLFCSELVALTLRQCNLLSIDNVSCVWITAFWGCQLMLHADATLSGHKFWIQMGTASVALPLPLPLPPPPPQVTTDGVAELIRALGQKYQFHG